MTTPLQSATAGGSYHDYVFAQLSATAVKHQLAARQTDDAVTELTRIIDLMQVAHHGNAEFATGGAQVLQHQPRGLGIQAGHIALLAAVSGGAGAGGRDPDLERARHGLIDEAIAVQVARRQERYRYRDDDAEQRAP